MSQQPETGLDRDWTYPLDMGPDGDRSMGYAPSLAPAITSFFASVKRQGRMNVPPELHLTAAFGELKLDLRDALFPTKHVLVVANSLCASMTVLLPPGAMVEDNSTTIAASHHVTQESEEHGPVIHLEGWAVFSDVKFVSDRW